MLILANQEEFFPTDRADLFRPVCISIQRTRAGSVHHLLFCYTVTLLLLKGCDPIELIIL